MLNIGKLPDRLRRSGGVRASTKALASGLLPLAVGLLVAFLLDRFQGIQPPLLLLLLAVCYSALTQVPGAGLVSVLATFALTMWLLHRPDSLPLAIEDATTTLYLLSGACALILLLGAYRGLRRESQRKIEIERARSSEARRALHEVLDSMGPHMFVALLDANGHVLEVNQPALTVTELTLDDLRGMPLQDSPLWAHDLRMVEKWTSGVSKARLGHSSRFDAVARVSGGRLIHIDCSLQPLHDAYGNIRMIVASAMSVDERETARRDAQRLLEILEAHFDCGPLAGISFDGDLRVVRWSATAARMWGYPASQILGKPARELPFLPDDQKSLLIGDLAALLEHRDAPAHRSLTSRRRHDNEILEGDWFYSRVSAEDANDETYLLCMINDTTERNRAARERDRSERLFRGVFDQAAVGIAIVDLKARFLQCNQAFREMTGYSEVELKRLDYCRLTHPDDLDKGRELAETFGSQGLDSYNIEQRIKRKNGKPLWVNLFVSRLPGGDGDDRFIAVAQDVDERVRAVQDYRRLGEELEAVVAERTAALEKTSQRWRDRNLALLRLNEASSLLSTSKTPAEVAEIASRYVPQIFPDTSGAIYLAGRINNGMLQWTSQWGSSGTSTRASIDFSTCWALRRGKPHHYAPDQATAPACEHIGDKTHLSYCLPIMVHGRAMGLLTLEYPPRPDVESEDTTDLTMLQALNEQMGLALANLRLNEDLREQAIRDPLTGLFNRRWFEEEVGRLLSGAERHQAPLALLMLDIDHFKQVNDEYGHTVGDEILCRVAAQMQAQMRAGDLAARHGGEEFVVALPGHDSTAAIRVAERLRKSIMTSTGNDSKLPAITVSIGIAAFPADGRSLKAIVKLADDALYEAKRRGRNRVHVHGMTVAEVAPLATD